MLAFILPVSSLAVGSLSNFSSVNEYRTGQFSDVPSTQWYASYVKIAYEYGLIDGKTATSYQPDSYLTLAEAIKLAACLNRIYYTGVSDLENGSPWYQPYVDYALSQKIIDQEYPNYGSNATRSEFAIILSKALPDEAMTAINRIDDGAVPDVSLGFSYGDAVYKLYRAGILTGSDTAGNFTPNTYIKRSEVATIVARMANAQYRKSLTLTSNNLTTEEIYAKCSPAVFDITVYGSSGAAIGSASGFFISSSGLAVTNYHVVDGAASAIITTSAGNTYNVSGICDYSADNDLALLQINGSGFPYLNIGDSTSIVTGASIYAIGSPLGLSSTISEGIISSSSRTVNGLNYIQISAQISQGSSGGALINKKGQVIGVTAATFVDGQNLNLAVPIHLIEDLNSTSFTPLSVSSPSVEYYSGYYPTPDFGVRYSVDLYGNSLLTSDGYVYDYYYYLKDDITTGFSDYFYGYGDLLEQSGFVFVEEYTDDDGYPTLVYTHETSGWYIIFGPTALEGIDFIAVIIAY